MNFKKYIITILSVILIMTLSVGCRNTGDQMSSANSLDNTSSTYGVVDVVENDNQSTESTLSSEDSEGQTSNNSSDIGSTTIPDDFVDVDTDDFEDDDLPPIYVEPTPDDSTSDGSSSSESIPTYGASLSAKGKMKTQKIDPGKSHYYKIKGASNRILTIESPNAYVIYNDVKYSAKNGVVSFFVESDELASAQIMFEIGNCGSQTESFTVQFLSEVGSKDNPEPLNSTSSKFTTTINLGRSSEYFYKYTATNKGKIRFYLLSDEENTLLTVGQMLFEYKDVEAKGCSDIIEETNYLKTSKDSTGVFIEFDTNNGDEFKISVAPIGNTSNTGTISIEWKIVV